MSLLFFSITTSKVLISREFQTLLALAAVAATVAAELGVGALFCLALQGVASSGGLTLHFS